MTANALEMRGIVAGYGRSTVLRELDLTVPAGSIVALLGPNGAGKTTLMRVASGLLGARQGAVHVGGQDVTRATPAARLRAGLCLIPEGRAVFPNLTVRENLRLQVPTWLSGGSYEPALDAFPALRGRLDDPAGRLSGGQQQMLALSRCFLSAPRVALLDEVSLGLAPQIIDEMFAALRQLADQGVTLLLVEQYAERALAMADQVHLLDRGEISFSGAPGDLDAEDLYGRYLGQGIEGTAP